MSSPEPYTSRIVNRYRHKVVTSVCVCDLGRIFDIFVRIFSVVRWSARRYNAYDRDDRGDGRFDRWRVSRDANMAHDGRIIEIENPYAAEAVRKSFCPTETVRWLDAAIQQVVAVCPLIYPPRDDSGGRVRVVARKVRIANDGQLLEKLVVLAQSRFAVEHSTTFAINGQNEIRATKSDFQIRRSFFILYIIVISFYIWLPKSIWLFICMKLNIRSYTEYTHTHTHTHTRRERGNVTRLTANRPVQTFGFLLLCSWQNVQNALRFCRNYPTSSFYRLNHDLLCQYFYISDRLLFGNLWARTVTIGGICFIILHCNHTKTTKYRFVSFWRVPDPCE